MTSRGVTSRRLCVSGFEYDPCICTVLTPVINVNRISKQVCDFGALTSYTALKCMFKDAFFVNAEVSHVNLLRCCCTVDFEHASHHSGKNITCLWASCVYCVVLLSIVCSHARHWFEWSIFMQVVIGDVDVIYALESLLTFREWVFRPRFT